MLNRCLTKELFDNFKNEYFIKLDEDPENKLFVGKTDFKPCFFIDGKTRRVNFKSTNVIDIYFRKNGKSQSRLFFVLKDQTLLDVFISLIQDIQKNIKKEKTYAIDFAYRRWLLWKKMFSNDNEILSEKAIRGLFAELIFLKYYEVQKYGIKKAVFSWGGSEYNKKDFENSDCWYEIKSSLSENGNITISSLEQLDSNFMGYLAVVILEKSTLEDTYSLNINELVDNITKRILDINVLDIFINKLQMQNYTYREEYNAYNYLVKKIVFYKVDSGFPKLTKSMMPNAIVNCTYQLALLAIDQYIEEVIIKE